jgi:hypothetical protein
MGEVHDLILRHGVEGARTRAENDAARRAIEAAAAVMAEEESRLGITHAGFAMTSLPHRAIQEAIWRRQGNKTTLLIESGRLASGDLVGVPFGSMARMIMLYLQTEAVRTSSPEVELGRCMNAWLVRMGIQAGGRTYRLVSEQARRISSCRLTFFTDLGGAELRQNGAFVQNAITLTNGDDRQPALWQDRVRLDESFWKSLIEHPVPVREEAIRAIGARSLAIDCYIWLAYRLHSLTRPTPITWAALHGQFGAGFRHVRQFKPEFRDALGLALAVYPEATVTGLDEVAGVVLHPSAPAIGKPAARRIGIS